MSTITVIGGTGRTGRLLIEQLQERGDAVTAIIRDAAKRSEIEALGAEVVVLNLETSSIAEFADAFAGSDAIIFAAGTRENEDNVDEVDRDGPQKAVKAAEQAGVKRYVQISAMGVRTGLPPGLDSKMQAYFEAKRGGDAVLTASSLDWTIIEPGELTEDTAVGKIELGEALGRSGEITRADVAATAIAVLDAPGSIGKAWEVLGGVTPVAQAVAEQASR